MLKSALSVNCTFILTRCWSEHCEIQKLLNGVRWLLRVFISFSGLEFSWILIGFYFDFRVRKTEMESRSLVFSQV